MTFVGNPRATVAVVGGGPAGLAAAHHLRVHADLRVILVAPGGTADFLAGTLTVATGDVPLRNYRMPIHAAGLEVRAGEVTAIEPGVLVVGSERIAVDAVVAAPGLALVPFGDAAESARPASSRTPVLSFWDLDGAAKHAQRLCAQTTGVVTVAITSPLYRCPPAPYGLAMRLARRAADAGHDLRVRLTTPEPRPLAKIGTNVSEFLAAACAQENVDIVYGVTPDPDALNNGVLVDGANTTYASDLIVAIPAHVPHALLAHVAGDDHFVAVDDKGRSAQEGLYVAGDAAAGPWPRASSPAVQSAIRAASGVLADLGIAHFDDPGLPQPDCFVDRGAGQFSRLQISYPSGPPPIGVPEVRISDAADAATSGFDGAVSTWRALCAGKASATR